MNLQTLTFIMSVAIQSSAAVLFATIGEVFTERGGILLAALFIAGILVGGDQLQTVMHLPSAVGLVLEATLLFLVLGSDFFSQCRICRRATEP